METKIILGSANFIQTYGIKKNLIKKHEVKKLFNIALKNRIKVIDTSPNYIRSEEIIGLLNNNRFKIISKIPPKPRNLKRKDIKIWVNQIVKTSLKKLKINKFECLLLHDANSLLRKNGKEIYRSVRNMKTKKFTKKIGISIYDFGTLDKILKKFRFDLIQVPFNIFDQRLISTGWLERLKKKKIEVHARSIFLQGMLLLRYSQLPNKLKKYSKDWIKWENWLKKNKLNPLQACLSFVFNQKQLDGIVVGCNSKSQFNQILKLKKMKYNFSLSNLNIKNRKLIDPRQWTN